MPLSTSFNSGGKTRYGGTSIIGTSSTGTAPDNAKLTFLVEAGKGNAKATVLVRSYPTKTTYKLGEGFDTTGFNVVVKEGVSEKSQQ